MQINRPATLATAKVAPMAPNSAGTRSGAALMATMMYAPEAIPAPPAPAIARPTIKAVLVGAIPKNLLAEQMSRFVNMARSLTTYKTTNFKDEDREQENVLDREKFESFSPKRLERSHGHEESTSIPGDVV